MSSSLLNDTVVVADEREPREKNTSWNDEAKTAYNNLMNTKKMTSGNLALLTTNQVLQFSIQVFDPFANLKKVGGNVTSESDTDSCSGSDSSDSD